MYAFYCGQSTLLLLKYTKSSRENGGEEVTRQKKNDPVLISVTIITKRIEYFRTSTIIEKLTPSTHGHGSFWKDTVSQPRLP